MPYLLSLTAYPIFRLEAVSGQAHPIRPDTQPGTMQVKIRLQRIGLFFHIPVWKGAKQ